MGSLREVYPIILPYAQVNNSKICILMFEHLPCFQATEKQHLQEHIPLKTKRKNC